MPHAFQPVFFSLSKGCIYQTKSNPYTKLLHITTASCVRLLHSLTLMCSAIKYYWLLTRIQDFCRQRQHRHCRTNCYRLFPKHHCNRLPVDPYGSLNFPPTWHLNIIKPSSLRIRNFNLGPPVEHIPCTWLTCWPNYTGNSSLRSK